MFHDLPPVVLQGASHWHLLWAVVIKEFSVWCSSLVPLNSALVIIESFHHLGRKNFSNLVIFWSHNWPISKPEFCNRVEVLTAVLFTAYPINGLEKHQVIWKCPEANFIFSIAVAQHLIRRTAGAKDSVSTKRIYYKSNFWRIRRYMSSQCKDPLFCSSGGYFRSHPLQRFGKSMYIANCWKLLFSCTRIKVNWAVKIR